jgi:hypothetical protein
MMPVAQDADPNQPRRLLESLTQSPSTDTNFGALPLNTYAQSLKLGCNHHPSKVYNEMMLSVRSRIAAAAIPFGTQPTRAKFPPLIITTALSSVLKP